MAIKESALPSKSSMAGGDYIRVVGSNGVSYKQPLRTVGKVVNAGSTLPSGTDLNTVTENGIYLISGSSSYTNSPTNYGELEVINHSAENTSNMMQRITTTDAIYFRYRGSGTWYAWRKVTSTAV